MCCLQKPRPLDPVKDEEYMKHIYGRALFHRQRTEHNEACRRYHLSPKSKLPRSPIRMSRAVVKGYFEYLTYQRLVLDEILNR